MTDELEMAPDAAAAPRGAFAIVAVVFALLYGWFLFGAVSNLVALPPLYEAGGVPELTPWPQLVLGVVLPVVAYGAALLLARGRALSTGALILAAGLAVTAGTALSIFALS